MRRGGPRAAYLLDGAIGGALALLAALLHAPLIFRTVGGCDEWHILTAGARLAQGEVMYRDVTHIAGPGSFYISAALFRLFGTRFEIGRVFMLVLFAAVTAALYGLARRLTGRIAAVLAAFWFVAFRLWSFPHWQMLHYASVALAFALFAFHVLHAERPVGSGRAAAAGLLAGAAFLTKQDSGALATLGCAGALVLGMVARRRDHGARERWLPVAVFCAAAAAPLVAAVLYFWAENALWPFILQTAWDTLVQHPLFVSGGGPEQVDYMPFPSLFPLLSQDQMLRHRLLAYMPALFWDLHWTDVGRSWLFQRTNLLDLAIKLAFRVPYAILLVEAIATVRAWRRETDGVRLAARTAQLVFAAAVLAALSKPRDWIHLSVLLAPLAPIAARQLAALGGSLRPPARWAFAATLGILGAAYLGLSAELAAGAVRAYVAPIAGPRGTAYARPLDAAPLQQVVDALTATPPERPVMAVPCVSAATFLAGRPCASRFPWLWPRDAYVDRDQQVIASLDAHPDATVVYTLSHVPTIPRVQAHAPVLFEGLAARYRFGPIFGPDALHLIIALAERRPPSPAPALRLADVLDAATAERARDDGVDRIGDARSVAGIATWPLTPRVLWISPASELETRVVLPVVVSPGAHLRLRAGINPDLWQAIAPFPVRLRVAVDGTELLSIRRDVFANPADRVWEPLDVDLAARAGEKVNVMLAVAADGWGGASGEIAGFEDPRLER
jgi:Dolichyl-phosphate-mannose-protein mannosyltransferase